MTNTELIGLIILFLVTSIFGVVTGSNSLITVPAMFQFGIDEKTAIATNMFGLTFMAIGGTIPFLRHGKIEPKRLSPLLIVTLIGSALGALLVGYITNQSVKLIVSVAMFVVVGFTLLKPGPKDADGEGRWTGSYWKRPLGLAVTFLLAIYGGLYSGGYVTILTASFVAFLGMSYAGSVGSTKLVNVFSSGIATLVFMWQRLVDYRLGAILAVTMFVGAYVGAHYAAKMNEVWLKRIFLSTVVILAVKTLYDYL
jgi:uncharacterized membrane protein YfcA